MVGTFAKDKTVVYWYHPLTKQRTHIGYASSSAEANLLRGEKDIAFYSQGDNRSLLPKCITLVNNLFVVSANMPINHISKDPYRKSINFGSFRSLREAKEHKAELLKTLLSDFDNLSFR